MPAAATTTEASAAKEVGAAATKIADDVAGYGVKYADDAVKFEVAELSSKIHTEKYYPDFKKLDIGSVERYNFEILG